MDYTLPDLPVGQRWKIAPSILDNTSQLILQEKRWWGWKKLDRAVIGDERFADRVTLHAYSIIKAQKSQVEYGIKEGTL